MKIEIIPVKTRVVRPPKDEIFDILDSLEVRDGDIVFISSKIVSIHQGRCVAIEEMRSELERAEEMGGRSGAEWVRDDERAERVGGAREVKKQLVRREAERELCYKNSRGYETNLTVTDGNLILGAGIDQSNADGHFILWPEEIDDFCRKIHTRSKKLTGVKKLGVVVTDSHTSPLRLGVTGFALGFYGLKPLEDKRGDEDIFGRKLHITTVNKIDPLAALAVSVMGESNEQTPIVIIRGYENIEFSEGYDMSNLKIGLEDDLYAPLLRVMPKV